MAPMRILWLTTRPPFPLDSGGKIVIHERIREMHRRGHRIHLVACEEEGDPAARGPVIEKLLTICETVDLFPRRWGVRLAMTTRTPFCASSRMPPQRLTRTLAQIAQRCDLIQVEHSAMIPASRAIRALAPGLPAVLTLHADCQPVFDKLSKDAEVRLAKRIVYAEEARRIQHLEDRALRGDEFRFVTFVSREHREAAARAAPSRADQFRFIPLSWGKWGGESSSPPRMGSGDALLLVASFLDEGNRLSASWLVERVLPLLKHKGVRVLLVGRHADRLRELAGGGVEIVSDPPDLGPWYEQAAVALVPVHNGGGVRVKLLEAVAMGIPVVTTPLGVEGTEFRDGEDLLVAATPEAFAHAIDAVLDDPAAASGRAARALSLFERLHSTRAVGDMLEAVHREAMR